MRVLGICGSLREDSNTNKIVKKVVESTGYDYELVCLVFRRNRNQTLHG
jgi:multimeric flavodoxin WrbA